MTIDKIDILDFKKRREIYDLLFKNPGLHLREISRKLDIPKTTANYHLRFLERKNLLRSEIKGKYTIYFAGNDIGSFEKNLLRVLRSDIPRRILFSAFTYDEMYPEEISRDLDIPLTTILYHLKNLEKFNFVKFFKKNRKTIYYINEREKIFILFNKYKHILMDDPYFSSFLDNMNYLKIYNNFPIKNTHKRNINTNQLCDVISQILPIPFRS